MPSSFRGACPARTSAEVWRGCRVRRGCRRARGVGRWSLSRVLLRVGRRVAVVGSGRAVSCCGFVGHGGCVVRGYGCPWRGPWWRGRGLREVSQRRLPSGVVLGSSSKQCKSTVEAVERSLTSRSSVHGQNSLSRGAKERRAHRRPSGRKRCYLERQTAQTVSTVLIV